MNFRVQVGASCCRPSGKIALLAPSRSSWRNFLDLFTLLDSIFTRFGVDFQGFFMDLGVDFERFRDPESCWKLCFHFVGYFYLWAFLQSFQTLFSERVLIYVFNSCLFLQQEAKTHGELIRGPAACAERLNKIRSVDQKNKTVYHWKAFSNMLKQVCCRSRLKHTKNVQGFNSRLTD